MTGIESTGFWIACGPILMQVVVLLWVWPGGLADRLERRR
jgi:hypothetical protein